MTNSKPRKRNNAAQDPLEQFVIRWARLKKLKQLLDQGKAVDLRMLTPVLGKQVRREFKQRWDAELRYRKSQTELPRVVKEYIELLKVADMMFGRAERNYAVAKMMTEKNKRLYGKAEAKYELALEFLESEYSKDRSLEQWFDRPLIFGVEGTIAPDQLAVPRPRKSRSHQNEAKSLSKRTGLQVTPTFATKTKASIKRELVEEAIAGTKKTYDALLAALKAAEQGQQQMAEQQNDKLKQMLRGLGKSSL